MAILLVGFLVLSLTGNVFPLFNVVSILGLFPLRLFWSKSVTADLYLRPTAAIRFLLAAYAFWITSYLLTTAPVSNLFSYDFLRCHGAIFVGYLPLLLLNDVGLSSRIVYRLIWMYLSILAGVALFGAALLLILALTGNLLFGLNILKSFVSLESGHEMPVMLQGLYRTHMTTGNLYALAALMMLCFILRIKKPKLISWESLVLVSLLAALILSGARTAYVAFAATFLIQFVRKKNAKHLLKISALFLVPVLVFCLSQPGIISRMSSIINYDSDSNVQERLRLYRQALGEFSDSPLIGVGFGRFDNSGKTYFGVRHLFYIATTGKMVGNVENLNEAHDSYLQFLAEGGLVGLVLMLGVWVATYRWAGCMRLLFRDKSKAGALCDAVQASVLLTLFSSITGTTMMMATTPLFVFTMVGLLRNVAASEYKAMIVRSTLLNAATGLPNPGTA